MVNMYFKLILLVCALKTVYLFDSCQKHTFCGDCITDPNSCVWCSAKEFNQQRCRTVNSTDNSWCPGTIHNPTSEATVDKNNDLSFSSQTGNVVQIKPQKYKLKLRPGQPVSFDFSFQAVKDYPVDMYFLLDSSKTMDVVKTITASASENIYKTLYAMTSDVYLGFGTFIDKNALPIAINVTSHLAYSFRHHLSLTSEFEKFKKIVSETPSGANRDVPEGGLDALAQVIVCNNIGWRKESRKLIVYMSDGPYHVAGDGKFAGIFQPYDGKCYTNNDGVYLNELTMDYPSISMVNKLAVQRDVIIIMAVNYELSNVYQNLKEKIHSSYLTYFDESITDTTMTGIIKNIYEKITKDIQLEVNMKKGQMKNYQITFEPDCTNGLNPQCKVHSGKQQNFKATIKLLNYDGNDQSSIDISVKGLKERLNLDIEVIKQCNCGNDSIENTPDCNGERLECGVCKCGELKYGEKCACTRSSLNLDKSTDTCKPAGNGTEECSGRGLCSCGSCECKSGFEGRYCECDMKNCPVGSGANGELCSGNGHCECAKCKCKQGWIGTACDCSDSKENCKTPGNKICNNRGNCKCDNCKCNPLAKWDQRHQTPQCEYLSSPRGHEQQCDYLKTCAECMINERENCDCDDGIIVTIVDKIQSNYFNSTDWMTCKNLRVKTGCYTDFVYQYDDDNYKIKLILQREKNCAENFIIAGFGSLIVLILIGIISLLAWKILTDARDRQEYMKFLEEHKDEIGTCVNPCYQPPSTTFRNPAFGSSFKN